MLAGNPDQSPQIALVRDLTDTQTVNFPDFQELEQSIRADPEVVSIERGKAWVFTASVLFRVLRPSGRRLRFKPPYDLPLAGDHRQRICVLAGPAFRRCADYIRPGSKAAILFDACKPWVSAEQVCRFVDDADITVCFVTHPAMVAPLQALTNRCRFYVMHEAVAPENYHPDLPKTIDVLSYGRKLPQYHEALLEGLPKKGFTYEHGFIEGREALLEKLGRSRITINFPRSTTDDQTDLPLVTMRYYQSMASRALMLGEAPPVMRDIFGYEPVVTADLRDPVAQVVSLLEGYEAYQPLIERNYQAVCQQHNYRARWAEVKATLQQLQGVR